jgi:hypothetical protein
MSALNRKADMLALETDVCYVPKADVSDLAAKRRLKLKKGGYGTTAPR